MSRVAVTAPHLTLLPPPPGKSGIDSRHYNAGIEPATSTAGPQAYCAWTSRPHQLEMTLFKRVHKPFSKKHQGRSRHGHEPPHWCILTPWLFFQFSSSLLQLQVINLVQVNCIILVNANQEVFGVEEGNLRPVLQPSPERWKPLLPPCLSQALNV